MVLLFGVTLLMMSGCEQEATPPSVTSGLLTATLNTEAPLSWIFTSAQAIDGGLIRCEEQVDGGAGEVHIIPLDGSSTILFGLKASSTYGCELIINGVRDESSRLEIFTDPLPDGVAAFEITVPSADPGRTGYALVGIGNQTNGDFHTFDYDYTLVVDAEGHVRWFMNTYSTGSVDISFIPAEVLGEPAFLWGGEGGEYVPPTIRNLNQRTLFVANMAPINDTENEGEIHHDAGLSADQRSIFYLMNQSLPPEDSSLDPWLGFIFKEVDLASNEIIWWWDSWTHGTEPGQLEACTPTSSFYPDCFHTNAIFDRWEDDPETGEPRLYLYVSQRSRNRVLKIDYESKKVVWRLGVDETDFTLLEPDGSIARDSRWFYYQHDVQRHGDRLTLYDNGGDRDNDPPWHSRVLELELDELNGTATIVFEYDEVDPETGETRWKERIWGGYDLLPDGTRLIARGHCYSTSACPDQAENDPSALIGLAAGDIPIVNWRLDFLERSTALYRAEHIESCALFNNASLCSELEDPLEP